MTAVLPQHLGATHRTTRPPSSRGQTRRLGPRHDSGCAPGTDDTPIGRLWFNAKDGQVRAATAGRTRPATASETS
jgi:hypothetical protein